MARPTIENLRAVSDFATTYNWNLKFIQFPKAVDNPADADVNIRCTSTTIPVMTNTVVTVSVRGHKVHQPGIGDYAGTIQLSFVEGVDSMIDAWIRSWREACWQTKFGVAQTKMDTEAIVQIERLDRQDTAIWAYKLIGCFLQAYDQPQLGSESSAFLPTITLQYDYFEDRQLASKVTNESTSITS